MVNKYMVQSFGLNDFGQLGDGTKIDAFAPSTVKIYSGVIGAGGGGRYSVFLKSDGGIAASGSNNLKCLCIDSDDFPQSDIPLTSPYMTGAQAISIGAGHSLAIKNDGTVWGWGTNYAGELGRGDSGYDTFVPAQVNTITDVISAAASRLGTPGFSLAVMSDGTVWAWGVNSSGMLGDGTYNERHSPVQVLTGGYRVAAGYAHSVFLKNDGTVWVSGTWGLGGGESCLSPTQVVGLTGIAAVSAGNYTSLALKNDGTVWAWGYGDNGCLGTGSYIYNSATPVQVNITDVVAIASGSQHCIALKSDGSVWTWGTNGSGQLGNNGVKNSVEYGPVAVIPPSSGTVVGVGAGNDTSYQIVSNDYYDISGIVSDVSGSPLQGVTVNISASGIEILGDSSTTTDINGYYVFSVVNGTHDVTPTLTDYAFDPSFISVVVTGADVPNQDFIAGAQISGNVQDSLSNNISGAHITIPPSAETATTDLNGDFATNHAVFPGSYHIQFDAVNAAKYSFAPTIPTAIEITDHNITQNYVLTSLRNDITFTLTDGNTLIPIANAIVKSRITYDSGAVMSLFQNTNINGQVTIEAYAGGQYSIYYLVPGYPSEILMGTVPDVGTPATLTSSPIADATYVWYDDCEYSIVPGEDTAQYSVNSGGFYTGLKSYIDELGQGVQTIESFLVSIGASATPVITGSNTVCTGGTVVLDAGEESPGVPYASYSWSGGGSDQTKTVGPGSYTVSVVTSGGCSGTSDPFEVVEVPGPSPVITGSHIVCNGATTVLDAGEESPGIPYVSYAWSGGGSSRTKTVGAGSYTVSVVTSDGCSGTSDVFEVTESAEISPTVSPDANPSSICIGSPGIILAGGTPPGGVWSGPGVISGIFYPGMAGAGIHVLTYEVTDGDCSGSTTISIEVFSTILVTVSPLSDVCENVPAFLLADGDPSGGSWSGAGMVGGLFDPSAAGIGTHLLTYTYIDENGCSGNASTDIVVLSAPDISIPDIPDLCENDGVVSLPDASPAGGTWSGPGVSGDTFDPREAGVGIHTLTYSVTDINGCSAIGTVEVAVLSVPTPSIYLSLINDYMFLMRTDDIYASYQWTVDGEDIVGANGPSIELDSHSELGLFYGVRVTTLDNDCIGFTEISLSIIFTPSFTGEEVCVQSIETSVMAVHTPVCFKDATFKTASRGSMPAGKYTIEYESGVDIKLSKPGDWLYMGCNSKTLVYSSPVHLGIGALPVGEVTHSSPPVYDSGYVYGSHFPANALLMEVRLSDRQMANDTRSNRLGVSPCKTFTKQSIFDESEMHSLMTMHYEYCIDNLTDFYAIYDKIFLVDGMFGEAAAFSRAPLVVDNLQYVNISEGTVSMWIKRLCKTIGTRYYIVDFEPFKSSSNGDLGFSLYIDERNRLTFEMIASYTDASGVVISRDVYAVRYPITSNDLDNGQFNHVAITWKNSPVVSSNFMRLYINGVKQSILKYDSGAKYGIPELTDEERQMGDYKAYVAVEKTSQVYFSGVLDEPIPDAAAEAYSGGQCGDEYATQSRDQCLNDIKSKMIYIDTPVGQPGPFNNNEYVGKDVILRSCVANYAGGGYGPYDPYNQYNPYDPYDPYASFTQCPDSSGDQVRRIVSNQASSLLVSSPFNETPLTDSQMFEIVDRAYEISAKLDKFMHTKLPQLKLEPNITGLRRYYNTYVVTASQEDRSLLPDDIFTGARIQDPPDFGAWIELMNHKPSYNYDSVPADYQDILVNGREVRNISVPNAAQLYDFTHIYVGSNIYSSLPGNVAIDQIAFYRRALTDEELAPYQRQNPIDLNALDVTLGYNYDASAIPVSKFTVLQDEQGRAFETHLNILNPFNFPIDKELLTNLLNMIKPASSVFYINFPPSGY